VGLGLADFGEDGVDGGGSEGGDSVQAFRGYQFGGAGAGLGESEPNGVFGMLLILWELSGKNWVCLCHFLRKFWWGRGLRGDSRGLSMLEIQ
jgi:hypothetical protein